MAGQVIELEAGVRYFRGDRGVLAHRQRLYLRRGAILESRILAKERSDARRADAALLPDFRHKAL